MHNLIDVQITFGVSNIESPEVPGVGKPLAGLSDAGHPTAHRLPSRRPVARTILIPAVAKPSWMHHRFASAQQDGVRPLASTMEQTEENRRL